MALSDCLIRAGYSADEIKELTKRANDFRNRGESVEDSFKRLIPVLEQEYLTSLDQIKEQLGVKSDRKTGARTENTKLKDAPLILGKPLHTIKKANDELEYRAKQNDRAPGSRAFNDPNPESRRIADEYKASKGYDTQDQGIITSLDVDHQKQIADAFDSMKHQPDDPEVQAAYEAMAAETLEQYQTLKGSGIQFEIYEGKGEPYANSQEMIDDVRNNNHLFILSTEKEFGQNPITDEQRNQNPLLRESGETDINGKPLLINDVFRGVHDFFGHTVRGNSFGALGEENAWAEHVSMYSPLAARAMTTETRGQNSWVNFGPNVRNEEGRIRKRGEEGYLSARERPFAEQKIGLLPEWASQPITSEKVTPPSTTTITEFKSRDTLSDALQKPGYTILTATQEANGDYTQESNVKANEKLRKELIEEFGQENVEEVRGVYKGVDQGPSYLVTNIDEGRAREIGAKYNQESVLTNKGNVMSNTGSYNPNLGNTLIGEEAMTQDFQSIIIDVGGEPLAFTMDIDWGTTVEAETTPEVSPQVENVNDINSRMYDKFNQLTTAINEAIEENRPKGAAGTKYDNSIDGNKFLQAFDQIDGRDPDKITDRAAVAKQMGELAEITPRLPKSIRDAVDRKLGMPLSEFMAGVREDNVARKKAGSVNLKKPKKNGVSEKTKNEKRGKGPGQGAQSSKVVNESSLKPVNEVVREIRNKVFGRDGLAAKLVPGTTVNAVIDEAVRDHITTDGTYSKEAHIASETLRGRKIPSASELVALGYALLRMRQIHDVRSEIYEKAKVQDHPDAGKYLQDLERATDQVDYYAQAIEVAGSHTGLALRIRQTVLTEEPLSESAILKRASKALPKGKTLTERYRELAKRFSTRASNLNREIRKLKEDRHKVGMEAKEAIAEAEIKNIKETPAKATKKKSSEIRRAKSLDDARKQLDSILKGKIC